MIEPPNKVPSGQKNRLMKILLGSVFVVIGVIGLVLPFLQGVVTIAAGVLLIADAVPSVDRRVKEIRARSAWIDRALHLVESDAGVVSVGKVTVAVVLTTILASLAAFLVTKL